MKIVNGFGKASRLSIHFVAIMVGPKQAMLRFNCQYKWLYLQEIKEMTHEPGQDYFGNVWYSEIQDFRFI